jgi:anaphase-promoting complex subunit 4
LERVGQYLQDKNLTLPPKTDTTNQWNTLLEQNECLKACPFIFPHHKNLSLIQQHNLLKNSIDQIFERLKSVIGEDFKLKGIVWNRNEATKWDKIDVSHINLEKENAALFALLESPTCLLIIEIGEDEKPKILKVQFEDKQAFENKFGTFGDLTYKHVQFFNEETLTMLLNNNLAGKNETYFLQFPIQRVRDLLVNEATTHMVDVRIASKTVNAYSLIEESGLKLLEGFDGATIAVSGPRNVASVLSETRKTLRIYLMDEEEEEEEVEMMSANNSSLENSKESI